MLLPKEFAFLAPVILGLVPRILSHQWRCIPSPREGEGDALASGEGYLKNVQKALNPRPQPKPEMSYLSPHPAGCGRRVSITLLPTATHIVIAFAMVLWILRRGTSSREYRRRMTLQVDAEKMLNQRPQHQPETSYLSPHPAGCGRRVSMTLLLKATHIDIALAMTLWILRRGTSSREYRRRMTLQTGAGGANLLPPVILLLCWLFPKVSFFLPNPAKTY